MVAREPSTLAFASNTPYRVGLVGGLALLPILALLAFWRVRRPEPACEPPQPWQPGPIASAVAIAAMGFVLSGVVGVVAVAAALATRYALQARPVLVHRVTVGVSAGGLILAGAALSRHPWRAVEGYGGHDWQIQLLALLAVAMLAASAVPLARRRA